MSTKPRQIQLFALLFIGVFALIAVLWFFVVRTEYVPVYENIRERDAAKIVEELDKAGVAYKLENDGHDILVPNGEAGGKALTRPPASSSKATFCTVRPGTDDATS